LQLPLIIIHITCISLSLRRTSAHIHLTSVLGVLGTQETSCILIAGLLERDTIDLFLPEFDKHWVIHLRETCCCSTNLCAWRPNTVYNNRSVRRHQPIQGCPLTLPDTLCPRQTPNRPPALPSPLFLEVDPSTSEDSDASLAAPDHPSASLLLLTLHLLRLELTLASICFRDAGIIEVIIDSVCPHQPSSSSLLQPSPACSHGLRR
jgi:hypothetical protein